MSDSPHWACSDYNFPVGHSVLPRKKFLSLVWCCTSVIAALGKQKQKELWGFEVSQGCVVRPCLKTQDMDQETLAIFLDTASETMYLFSCSLWDLCVCVHLSFIFISLWHFLGEFLWTFSSLIAPSTVSNCCWVRPPAFQQSCVLSFSFSFFFTQTGNYTWFV